MHANYKLAALALASSVAAQTTHSVMVGPGLIFDPNTLEGAEEGDMVEVTFNEVMHNIASGSFDSPCQYNSDVNLFSGPFDMGQVFRFMVNSTDPQVFYCSVGMHCQNGMALVINPSDDQTYEAYASGAEGTMSQTPDVQAPIGGMVVTEEDSDMGQGTSSMMPSSTMSMSMSMSASMTSSSTMMPTSSSSDQASDSNDSDNSDMDQDGAASGLRVGGLAMVGAFAAGALAFAL